VSAQWTLGSSVGSAPYVKASTNLGYNIPSTLTSLNGNTVTLPATAADDTFPDTTDLTDLFTIDWQMSFDGGSTWQAAGTSQNPIYRCLLGPASAVPTLYRTVVHLACSNGGASTADEAVAKTWELFSASIPTNRHVGPRNVMGWDATAQTWTRPLYYYQKSDANHRHFGENAQNSVADLLGPTYGGSGQCGVWAQFLQSALAVNGVSSTVIDATIIPTSGYGLFWVNAWTENDMTTDFSFPGVYFSNDLMPNPAGGNYGAMTDGTGAAGQNSPTPSEKCWSDHAFVQYGSLYYDPSYGLIHTGPADLQSYCIKCFGTSDGRGPNGEYRYKLTKVTQTVIQF
jgi:hypothetical protein